MRRSTNSESPGCHLPAPSVALRASLLSVCQVVASINRNIGGPAVTVPKLADALVANEMQSHVFTLDYPCHGPQQLIQRATLHTIAAGYLARSIRGFSPKSRAILRRLASGFDLIHNHGLWMFPNRDARIAAVRAKIPLIISPRGMLSGWALGRSRYKKRLVWMLFERANLHAAHGFHATSDEEMTSIRSVGLRQPIAVIPNGVELPNLNNLPGRNLIEAKFPRLRGKNWLLFLSRLHPKKGLREMLDVWAALGDKRNGWKLIIAGPDLDHYRSELDVLVRKHQLENEIVFTGMVEGAERECLLGRSDVFVLPTHSENFGLVIAESLAAGVPVITTHGAPWQELQSNQCGWWIDLGSLQSALEEAMSLSREARCEMGKRGRDLVHKKYSWERVGEQMAQFYRWCISGGPCPPFVHEP